MVAARFQRGDATEAEYLAAYEKNSAYQTEAAKAAAAYDKMDKDRALMGVTPRVSDKREHKHKAIRKLNNTLRKHNVGVEIPDTDAKIADSLNQALGLSGNENLKFQGGSYRSPEATTNEPYDSSQHDSSGVPRSSQEILDQVDGHKRDLKGFNGTTDDEGIFRR